MTRVSIGVPVYNGMPYLPEAIESILSQDHADLEIVICDNASTDGTSDYCQRISQLDPRVRYQRLDTNIGAVANFQRCLELTTGEFFAWVAHDDRLDRRFVSACLHALEQRPEATMCTPAHRVIDEMGRLVETRKEPSGLASDDAATRLRAHLWRRGWLTIYGLARRRTLEEVGPPPAVWGFDVLLVWRLLLLGPILVINEPLTDYRVFRNKTEDSALTGLTAEPSRAEFPYTRMRHSLREALGGLAISQPTRAAARATLSRWMLSRYYRELLFSDLFIVLQRLWWRRARARAAALVPAMLMLSPRLAARGLRREWRAARRPR